jgi:hypothetical protein
MDVGVDSHDFRPWHFDEIQAVMKPKADAREQHLHEKHLTMERDEKLDADRRAALAEVSAYDQEIGL